MRTLGYMLLLLVAFTIGMVGTVAASRAIVAAAAAQPSVQKPTGSPARAPAPARRDRSSSIEC